jgi:glutamate-1-semialdehyde 2,1-aminomutase
MIENGVFLPPSQFESWFLSTRLNKKDMQKIKAAIDVAMEDVSNISN